MRAAVCMPMLDAQAARQAASLLYRLLTRKPLSSPPSWRARSPAQTQKLHLHRGLQLDGRPDTTKQEAKIWEKKLNEMENEGAKKRDEQNFNVAK